MVHAVREFGAVDEMPAVEGYSHDDARLCGAGRGLRMKQDTPSAPFTTRPLPLVLRRAASSPMPVTHLAHDPEGW